MFVLFQLYYRWFHIRLLDRTIVQLRIGQIGRHRLVRLQHLFGVIVTCHRDVVLIVLVRNGRIFRGIHDALNCTDFRCHHVTYVTGHRVEDFLAIANRDDGIFETLLIDKNHRFNYYNPD